MMRFGYDSWGMMGGGVGFVAVIAWLAIVVDLVLLGVWLWKQIKK